MLGNKYIVTIDDGIPDRAELLATARTRVRRARLAVFGILLVGASILTVTVFVTADRATSLEKTLVLLLPVTLTVIAAVVLYPWVRRQDRDPQLAVGADTSTRRAVQKALRAGVASDARIDALARDAATRGLRNTWNIWMIGAGVVLEVVGMALRVIGGPLTTEDLILMAVMAPSAILIIGSAGLTRYRSRRYLRRAGLA